MYATDGLVVRRLAPSNLKNKMSEKFPLDTYMSNTMLDVDFDNEDGEDLLVESEFTF